MHHLSTGRESERRASVLLADDHPVMLSGLRRLLEVSFDVVDAVMGGGALLAAAEKCQPDLVITDISMPDIDGIEVTRRLRTVAPRTRVLILSVHGESSWVRAAFAAGAWGFLTKASAPEEIEDAVREVLSGRFYVSPQVARAAIFAHGEAVPPLLEKARAGDVLTARELDIVRLVGSGLGNKEIAQRLGVSVATVRTHLNSVYGKLKLESRVELALSSRTAAAVGLA